MRSFQSNLLSKYPTWTSFVKGMIQSPYRSAIKLGSILYVGLQFSSPFTFTSWPKIFPLASTLSFIVLSTVWYVSKFISCCPSCKMSHSEKWIIIFKLVFYCWKLGSWDSFYEKANLCFDCTFIDSRRVSEFCLGNKFSIMNPFWQRLHK